jgi:hypothetical protein
MNLDNLKPAWQQFRLLNSMQPMAQEEIIFIINRAEDMSASKIHRFLMGSVMFIILAVCFQGG